MPRILNTTLLPHSDDETHSPAHYRFPLQLAAALTAAGIVASGVDAQSTGNITAVYDLLERILPGSSVHFQLALVDSCLGAENGKACFSLSDLGPGTPLSVSGTTASEVAAGIGHYMRDYLNFTLGWPRGGGLLVYTPTTWPSLGSGPTTVTRARIVPFSYIENVCTHSYSLVWYDQSQWEAYIDWMALSGINMALASESCLCMSHQPTPGRTVRVYVPSTLTDLRTLAAPLFPLSLVLCSDGPGGGGVQGVPILRADGRADPHVVGGNTC